MGIPFYHSFDYYTVLVSILTNSSYYYMFFATDYLRKIFWDPIWDGNEEEARNRIRKYILTTKGNSINDALDILKGMKLKCTAVQEVINMLIMHE